LCFDEKIFNLKKKIMGTNGTNGHRASMIDGSWELRILVTDLQVERTIRVQSDLHVGGVMIKLVDELGKPT
jgi:hypothetical protein